MTTQKALTTSTSFAIIEAPEDMGSLLGEALAPGETLSLSAFPTIKIPAGGGTVWTLPDGEAAKTITCIILARQPVRAYWRSVFSGEGNPPDCSSSDNVIGHGDPGGECASCPLNEWGSGKDDAKACRQITRLFVLLPESQLPVLIPLPPSSYKAAQSYVLGLAGRGKRFYGVVTEIGLAQEKSKGGITYSRATFQVKETLSEAAASAIAGYREMLLPALVSAPISEAEEV